LEQVRRVFLGCVPLLVAAFAACSGSAGGSVTVVPGDSATPTGEPGTPVPNGTAPGTSSPGPTASATPTPGEDGSIVVACHDPLAPLDKQHRLPADCVPADLVEVPAAFTFGGGQLMTTTAADALVTLLNAAAEDGYLMYAASSYRSFEQQAITFQSWVDRKGLEAAERESARAGHSEHQLGTTTDLTTTANGGNLDAFRGTPEAEWVAANSWKYGFIVSYPPDSEHITGYVWEPWHIRYVGVDIAAEVHASGLTLGEFLLQR
jgi:D-alanyl-D-alanine carboxypeptidase